MTIRELDETKTVQLLKGIDIPPRPQVLQIVMAEQQKKDPDLRKISVAVEKDAGMSAAMLRAANSPAFGLRKKVTSISSAVMLLGLNNSTSLITGLSLRVAMTPKSSQAKLNRFWNTAADIAVICSILAQRFKIMAADQAYIIGLFHDCGIPLMMQRFSNYAEKLAQSAPDAQELLVNLEEQHFNTNHALVGYLVARSWYLPEEIRLVILNHHDEELLLKPDGDLLVRQVAMLTLACHLCYSDHWESEDTFWLRVGKNVMQFFDLSDEGLKDLDSDIKDILATL